MKRRVKFIRPLHLLVMAANVALFAGVIAAVSLYLRSALRTEILQHEAESMEAVALMQLRAGKNDLSRLGVGDPIEDAFTALLESSRLRGVLALQLIDPPGEVRASLPLNETPPAHAWWNNASTGGKPAAQFYPRGSLETVYGISDDKPSEAGIAPLVEMAIPLRAVDSGKPLGVAHYWIDGTSIAGEFSRIDRRLAGQAGLAFLVSSIVVTGVLSWAFFRLEMSNRKLRAQGADLARANVELAFAAKTAAIGAVSAHLIHEIKNPLTGLEFLINYQVAKPDDPTLAESWQLAANATRRLRDLINQVTGVLRDEAAPRESYIINAEEIGQAVHARLASVAERRKVALVCELDRDYAMEARTGNLTTLILTNLAGNALEASPPGTEVRITAQSKADEIQFEVADSGPGLPPEVRESLFRPLKSNKSGGSGVGLAISRQLAQHMGGRLELSRTGEQGTAFLLAVPALRSATLDTTSPL